jgi:hypothetical protein
LYGLGVSGPRRIFVTDIFTFGNGLIWPSNLRINLRMIWFFQPLSEAMTRCVFTCG